MRADGPRPTLIYDGECGFCRRSVDLLRRWDREQRIALVPFQDQARVATPEQFREALQRENHTLKRSLTDPRLFSGIGNAYSDEILWEAKLLPLRRRASLKPEDEEALFNAIPSVLARATEAILANPSYEESKQDRKFMAVHMKGGQACPRCGHRISQLGTNREPLNFCRGCQF